MYSKYRIDVSKMRRAKKNASWTYRRDVSRWMGEMSVSNRPFPEKMGGQMSTQGIMLDWLPWLSSIYRIILRNYIGGSTDE